MIAEKASNMFPRLLNKVRVATIQVGYAKMLFVSSILASPNFPAHQPFLTIGLFCRYWAICSGGPFVLVHGAKIHM